MNLDPSVFSVHDVSKFPILTVRNEAIQPGYAATWESEMNVLVAHDKPFAVLYVEMLGEETHEDLKQRGLWLARHKSNLARLCRVLVTVETDDTRREAARKRGRGVTQAFGVPHRAVSSVEEAVNIAKGRLTAD